MKSRFISILLVASMLGLNAAQAAANFAEIGSIQGKVLVNQGSGFVALSDGASLKAGDRVMVGKDSGAVIAYANGCSVAVNESKVLTIAKVAPCKVGEHVAMIGSSLVAPVAGSVDSPLGIPLPLLVVGGGAVAVGAYFVFKGNCLSAC